jgi:hypothetical protein
MGSVAASKGEVMNYSVIDPILDDFEKVLKELRVKYSIPHATIERRRLDLPQISLSWLAEDAIWRNINVLIDIEQSTADGFVSRIEINAWQDVREHNRWIRRWRHQDLYVGNMVESLQPWHHEKIFIKGYNTVSHWTPSDLTSHHPFAQAAAELLEQQYKSRC